MKRKWIWILFLGLVFLPATAKATIPTETLIEINYLDKDSLFLQGEHNFTFLTSDTGTNDIKIDVLYNNVTGWSIVKVESKPINITWYFINNTKNYYYLDQSTDKIYIVKVNYSKVEVPPNPYEEEINNLSKQVSTLIQDLVELNQSYQNLSNDYNAMINDYNRIKSMESSWLNQISTLKANVSALKSENNLLRDQVNQLKNDKEYWKNEYDKIEAKYLELKKKWDDIFTRIFLPGLIGFVAGVVVLKGYDGIRKIKYPSLSKFKWQRRKNLSEIKQSKYIEPKPVQDFKDGLYTSVLGESYIEGKKEPYWKQEVDTNTEKVYKYDEVELKIKKIRPEDSTIKDEAKYQHSVWRVYVDGEMYEDVIIRNDEELEKLVKHYQSEIEKSLKGE